MSCLKFRSAMIPLNSETPRICLCPYCQLTFYCQWMQCNFLLIFIPWYYQFVIQLILGVWLFNFWTDYCRFSNLNFMCFVYLRLFNILATFIDTKTCVRIRLISSKRWISWFMIFFFKTLYPLLQIMII